MSERGSVTVLMTAVTALLSLLLVASVSLGGVVAARTQARLAADASALAAAVASHPDTGRGPPAAAAAQVAQANGAELLGCICPVLADLGKRVAMVTVAIAIEVPLFGRVTVRAVSRAEFDPMAWLGR